ncbi:MAG TPA: hypothetical protein VFR58_18570 [Flavisolibacter sp.]|nr:hypothetical protein [Flavisolibacter sp.]
MRYLFILLVFLSVKSQAQWKDYMLTEKGDTLNRTDLKGMKQGPWVVKVDQVRGERGYEEEGFFTDDKKEGVWRRFSLEGDLIAIESYSFGMKSGKCMYFTNAGQPLREEHWRAISPKNPFDTVDILDVNDPSKVLRKQIVRVEPNSYKHGTWTYFDPAYGTVEKTEQWIMNKSKEELDAAAAAADDMAPIDPAGNTSTAKKEEKKAASTKPKEVLEFEKKNSGKKKMKVRDGSTGG